MIPFFLFQRKTKIDELQRKLEALKSKVKILQVDKEKSEENKENTVRLVLT